ncbi:FAD:protein FMN transferase [Acidipropionibacterium virtanenii]|uniref:Uncharacterized protein n=1 Tax=Acidipropionibacterium virtanenii TaxID=2057246 RepID=A0A344UQ22_9ACTN|nr:FAD:protein FMN transferase [Acidipropionibacterium virtanenii]AXE37370.1 hypothetical protein JS278_00173 [Acidipropionibacterium virtanenii]
MTTATTASGKFSIRRIDAPFTQRSVFDTPPVQGCVLATPSMQRRLPDAPLVRRCVFDVGDAAVSVTTSCRLDPRTYSQVLHAVRAEFTCTDRSRGGPDPRTVDPGVDLSGARAMAVDAAGRILVAAGIENWCVTAGGDVLTCGPAPVHGEPWAVGITEPGGDALISQAVCRGDLRAVSTVTADSLDAAAGTLFSQVTVVAPDIMTARLLAAGIRDGDSSDLLLAIARGCEVLAFTADGRAWASSAFRA